MSEGKYLIVGDVHGCVREFKSLLKEVDFWAKPRMVYSVGDLLDKNPGTGNYIQLLILCRALNQEGLFSMVKGNHEAKHLKFHDRDLREKNGGPKNQMAPAKYPDSNVDFWDTRNQLLQLKQNHWDPFIWLDQFPYYKYINKDLCILHGGLEPNKKPEKMPEDTICRVREIKPNGRMASLSEITPDMPFWTDFYDRQYQNDGTLPFVVYGHSNHSEPRRTTGTWGIDALIHGQQLTGILYPEFELVSVPLEMDYFSDTEGEE